MIRSFKKLYQSKKLWSEWKTGQRKSRQQRRRIRPQVEQLEDRLAPAGAYQHVLIISVDGLRQADLADPALQAYLTNINSLKTSGITYTNASTSTPSDSFPGELNYLTGASAGANGVFYDDSYSRTLLPPALVGGNTPGSEVQNFENLEFNFNNISGTNSSASGYNASAIDPAALPLAAIIGVVNEVDTTATAGGNTTTTYQLLHAPIDNDGMVSGTILGAAFTSTIVDPNILLGPPHVDTVALNVTSAGTNNLTQATLNLSNGLLTLTFGTAPAAGSQVTVSYNYGIPVYPHNYLQNNTIYTVAAAAGLPTAFADKHPSYDLVNGPNGLPNGTGIIDQFTPEINSTVAIDTAHPAHALVPGSNIMTQLVDSSYNPNNIPLPSGDTTKAVATTAANDDLKTQAIINEINGMNSLGTTFFNNGATPVSPALFGVNFQSVSVGEKLTKNPDGTPGGIQLVNGQEVISANIQNGFTAADGAIGKIVNALKANNGNNNLANFNNTLIVVTAKHGQNPRISNSPPLAGNIGDPISQALTNAGLINSIGQITEDDVALIWLTPQAQATQSAAVLAALQNYKATSAFQEINQILAGPQLAALGLGDPTKNDRTPDFIITLKPGFIYTGSKGKIAEHGGFSPDDTHVALITASGGLAPGLQGLSLNNLVSTKQVAVTALQALGLNPSSLPGGTPASGLTIAPGYNVTQFSTAPPAGLSELDSIAVDNTHLAVPGTTSGPEIYASYANGSAKDGSAGSSNIVEYTLAGAVVHTYTIAGHSDGLKVDPLTHLVWSLQNEDANPTLFLIDPVAQTQTQYTLAPTLNGGGYDDITFAGGNAYLTESNPSKNPNTDPAVVQVTLNNITHQAVVTTVLLGNANATNLVTNVTAPLNLQDPDSMTADQYGNLVLTSQSDDEIVTIKHPGTANQSVTVVPLADAASTPVSVDDTLFTPSAAGEVLATDLTTGKIYIITGPAVNSGLVLSAARDIGQIGNLNTATGLFTPVISGLGSPRGLAFVQNPSQLTGALFEGTTALPTSASATSITADLTVASITHSPTPALIGNPVTFTVTVTNNGPGTVTSLSLVNQVTDAKNQQGLTAAILTPSTGIYNPATGTWALTLASGASATLTETGTVAASASGFLVDSATVFPSSGTTDPNFANNFRKDIDNVALPVNVSIGPLTDNVGGNGVPGNPVTFNFTVTNNGTTVANGVTVADSLPAGFVASSGKYSSSPLGGATVTAPTGSNTNSINTTVNLPVGGSVTFTFTATIDPAFAGPTLANTASITLPASLANKPGANTNSTDTLNIKPTADLEIAPIGDNSANGSIGAGATLTYNIFVTNNGPSAVTGATFLGSIDPNLIPGATFIGPNNPTATVVPAGGILDTLSLAPHTTVSYTVTGTAPAAGTPLSTSASIFSPIDPNTSNNSRTDNITVVAPTDPAVAGAQGLQQIQHFVVIYQENWSFDSLYGSFPGANGIPPSASLPPQVDRITGLPISQQAIYNPAFSYDPATMSNPPIPLDNNDNIDSRFTIIPGNPNSGAAVDTLLPYSLFQFIKPTDNTGDIVHRFYTEQAQIDNGGIAGASGAMDKFVTWSDNPGLVMSHFNATGLPEGLLAQQYTMDDNFFHAAYGGSFLNHQWLISAQSPVYPNAPSKLLPVLDPVTGQLALNANGKIIQDGKITPIGSVPITNSSTGQTFDKNYAINTIFSTGLIPDFNGSAKITQVGPNSFTLDNGLLPLQNDSNPNDPTRPYIPTIGDLLNNKGLSWKYYSGGWDNALLGSPSNPVNKGFTGGSPMAPPGTIDPADPNFQWHHQPFAYYDNFAPFLFDPTTGTFTVNNSATTRNSASFTDGTAGTMHLDDESQLFKDLAAGSLPTVSFIKQLGPNNEHPGYTSLAQGQQSTADIVHAIQNSPEWKNTAIIITYDENGGMWDHVSAPDANGIWGDGTRVPAIVISPYAQQHFVDDTQHDTLSILKTIENRFNLAPLGKYDAAASSLASSFSNVAHVDINNAYLQPDANKLGSFVLIVQGTQGTTPDNISLTLSGGNIVVTNNGTTLAPASVFAAATISRIEVYAQTGTGTGSITVGAGITAPAFLFGGNGGHVTISDLSGPSVIVGGSAGHNTLSAGPNSIIIGSAVGSDSLTSHGNATGGDIVIAGSTINSANLDALMSIETEWMSTTDTFAQKTAKILAGVPALSQLTSTQTPPTSTTTTQTYSLNPGPATPTNPVSVFRNTNGSNLTSNSALDWFFAHNGLDSVAGTPGLITQLP
jgi:phospholipase C